MKHKMRNTVKVWVGVCCAIAAALLLFYLVQAGMPLPPTLGVR